MVRKPWSGQTEGVLADSQGAKPGSRVDPRDGGLRNKKWRYVPARDTNVAATIARFKKHMKEADAVKQAANVKPIRGRA
jgi:hypothetical protein